MPNWVTNKGTITADKETIDAIFSRITGRDTQFDFNKIIPEPKTKEKCPAQYYVNEHSYIVLDDDRPWFDWYNWHLDNWDTKWNACHANVERTSDTELIVLFDTAWSFPASIWEKLATKYKTATFDIKFADEDLGNNCGYFHAENGQIDLQWIDTLEFACEVWGYDMDEVIPDCMKEAML